MLVRNPNCFLRRPFILISVIQRKFCKFLVVISSYKLLQEVANLEEYSMKISHPDITYARTFNKELGKMS